MVIVVQPGNTKFRKCNFFTRKFLTKRQIFDLISEYDGQIYGEYNENAKGIYYKIVPYYDKVLNNVRKGIKNDFVTNNVTKLALKIKDNPSILVAFPPIIIVNVDSVMVLIGYLPSIYCRNILIKKILDGANLDSR